MIQNTVYGTTVIRQRYKVIYYTSVLNLREGPEGLLKVTLGTDRGEIMGGRSLFLAECRLKGTAK